MPSKASRRRIGELAELDRHQIPDHTRRLIEGCKQLDPLYPDRRLWAWAHMLGFRGHFSSKSRRYSTTLGELRQARADFRAAPEREALGLDDRERTPSSSSPTGSTPATATPPANPPSPPPSPATSSTTAKPPAKPYATNSRRKEPQHERPAPRRASPGA